MRKFTMDFQCDNVSFGESGSELVTAISDTLARLAEDVVMGKLYLGQTYAILDVNGNRIGSAKIDSDRGERVGRLPNVARGRMTDRDLRVAVHDLGLNIRKQDGEYRINWPGADEDQAYYTDDAQDALDTARAMAQRGDRSRGRR